MSLLISIRIITLSTQSQKESCEAPAMNQEALAKLEISAKKVKNRWPYKTMAKMKILVLKIKICLILWRNFELKEIKETKEIKILAVEGFIIFLTKQI